MRYRYSMRVGASDVGSRVVIRWRRPSSGSGSDSGSGGGPRPGPGSDEVADVLGVLESLSDEAFVVRKASGELVTVPRDRVLAAKPVPPAPPRKPRGSQPPG
jgi:hypothetical protein